MIYYHVSPEPYNSHLLLVFFKLPASTAKLLPYRRGDDYYSTAYSNTDSRLILPADEGQGLEGIRERFLDFGDYLSTDVRDDSIKSSVRLTIERRSYYGNVQSIPFL